MPETTFTDEQRSDFLVKLNEGDVNVDDFEAKLMDSNLVRIERFKKETRYSEGQRNFIDKMIKKYRDQIKW